MQTRTEEQITTDTLNLQALIADAGYEFFGERVVGIDTLCVYAGPSAFAFIADLVVAAKPYAGEIHDMLASAIRCAKSHGSPKGDIVVFHGWPHIDV